MLKLSSFKLESSASISSSTVSHSAGFQRATLGSGEGRMSSPTGQNFGGSLDMLARCKIGLVRAGGKMYLRMFCLLDMRPRAGLRWAQLIIMSAEAEPDRDIISRATSQPSPIVSHRNIMSTGVSSSEVNAEGIMLFEQPFARVSGPYLIHFSTLIQVGGGRFRLRTTGRSFGRPSDK